MSTWRQRHPGHMLDTAPGPLSSADTTFSVPAKDSSHELHSCTVAQGFVSLVNGMDGGKGLTRSQCCPVKPFWLQEAPLCSHPWGRNTAELSSAEATFPLKGCICFHSESQESSYRFCGPVLKNRGCSWLLQAPGI